MASEILGLFGGKSPQELRNAYLDSLMVSPAQMAQQSLLQQVVSMGQNAGSMLGVGVGGLLGGEAPGVREQQTIADIYKNIQTLDLPTESAKFKVFATELGKAGLTRQAAIASEKASKAASQELKDQETTLGIEEKKLSNYFNRATLIPRVQSAFVKLDSDKQALEKAKQDYAQADKTNPIAVQQAAQTLANAQQTFKKTAAEIKQFEALSPSVVAEAKAKATSAQLGVNKDVQAAAARQMMSEFAEGSPEYEMARNQLLAIEAPSSLAPQKISFGTDREAVAAAKFNNRSFAELTPTEKQVVNDTVDAEAIARMAAQGSGTSDVTKITAAKTAVRTAIQPYRDKIGLADQALTQLNMNSPLAEAQVDRALAGLAGDKQLSMAEVNAVANRHGFVGSAANALQRFIDGRATPEDRRQKRILLEAVREAAVTSMNKQLDYEAGVYAGSALSDDQVKKLTEPLRPSSLAEMYLRNSGKPYEPEKYNYRVVNGVVQRAPK